MDSFQTSSLWDRCLASIYRHEGTPLNVSDSDRILFSRFNRGPVSVGYAGFPCSRTCKNRELKKADLDQLLDFARSTGVSLLRWSSEHANYQGLPPPVATTVETRIDLMPSWSSKNLKSSVARNIRKAEKAGIASGNNDAPPERMFSMYRDTVVANGGYVRYTQEYFNALAEACKSSELFNTHTAWSGDGLAGYVVTAKSGDWVYYLHGASDPGYTALRPMDHLFSRLLDSLSDGSCEVFNFLSSPPAQTGLVRFKEKWGGTSRKINHYSVPCSLTGKLLSRFGI